MSHYISTVINGKEVILTGGSSHTTISAVSESGFDIYGAFDSAELDGGWSGTGGVKVNFKRAKEAYKHAVAWAMAMKKSFPKEFQKELQEITRSNKEFKDYLFNDIFEIADMENIIAEIREYHSYMDEKTVERAFYLLYGILSFTHKIYKYTKNGGEIDIIFA